MTDRILESEEFQDFGMDEALDEAMEGDNPVTEISFNIDYEQDAVLTAQLEGIGVSAEIAEEPLPVSMEGVVVPEGFTLIDGVLVPVEIAAGEVEEIEPAGLIGGGASAGPFVLGNIGPDADLTGLLPYTEFIFPVEQEEELANEFTNDEPTAFVIVDEPLPGDPDLTPNTTEVSESGLDGGSTEGDGSDSTTGIIDIDPGDDGLGSVVIDGVDVTTGGIVTGDFGTLTVTVSPTGDFSWVYVLDDPATHPDNPGSGTNEGLLDVFDVVVTDGNGDTAPDSLTVGILDDGPVALDDVNAVSEDGPLVATGNVIIENDIPGADGGAVTALDHGGRAFAPGDEIPTEYGTLVVDEDGGYIFTLDNDNADVQALIVGETLTVETTYTLTDGDGDSVTAVLTITINGADDGVVISGLDVDGGEVTVDEDDLADGSSPDAAALTQGGDFDVDTPDGLNDVALAGVSLVVDGVFVGGMPSVDTDFGTLVITGFTPVTSPNGTVIGGNFTFEFTLDENTTDHAPGDNIENVISESLVLEVTDRDGDSATDTLDINVIDDIPAISVDSTAAPVLVTDDTDIADSDMGDFSSLFTSAFGADGAGSLVYDLSVSGPSGLVDVLTGEDVILSVNAAFTLTLDPATGEITQTQLRAVEHDDPLDPSEDGSPAVLTSSVTLTATITDSDGDTESAGVEIGSSFTFEDDGPSAVDDGETQLVEDTPVMRRVLTVLMRIRALSL